MLSRLLASFRPRLRFQWLAALLALLTGLQAAEPRFVPEKPETFFITPGQDAVLTWKARDTSPTEPPPAFRLTDYTGHEFQRGETVRREDGALQAKVNLPSGYYDLELGGETFGVVALPAWNGARDAFFGMDAVLNWLDRRPEARASLIAGMKRCGIAMARERINWNQVEPTAGTWNWDEHDHAWDLRQIYARDGLPVLEMFHSPGPSAGAFPVKNSYPQNLVTLAKSWPVIYEKLKDTWGGLEVWNEPEGRFGSHLPADQYAVLVKAMRYSLQTAGVKAPLGGGVFMGGDPAVFHQFCALNGLLENVDFISIHDYKAATKMERLIAVHRAWMKENARESLPLWITECGWAWDKAGGRPPLDQDSRSALETTMKGAEAKACGIARYMPFCLAFYEEDGSKSFSLMGRELTPLRSMGAYAQSIRALAGRDYVGDLAVTDKSILRARVFDPAPGNSDHAKVIVLYTDEVRPGAKVTLPVKASRVEGIDGRVLAQAEDGSIPIPDGMTYVWAKDVPVQADTGAMKLLAASRAPEPPAPVAGPIILQYLPNMAQGNFTTTRYIVTEDHAGEMKVDVRVHNLAKTAGRVTLHLHLPGDATPLPADRTQTVEVAPESVIEAHWTVDARGRWQTPEALSVLIDGERADGSKISPLAAPIMVERSFADYLPAFARQDRVEIAALPRWTANINKIGAQQMEIDPSGLWRLKVQFKPGDKWVYPKLRIEKGALAGADGFLVRARTESAANVRMMVFTQSGAGCATTDPIVPADGKWHTAYVPLSLFEPSASAADKTNGALDLAGVDRISVGMHDTSKDGVNTLEVSDLLIVKKAPAAK